MTLLLVWGKSICDPKTTNLLKKDEKAEILKLSNFNNLSKICISQYYSLICVGKNRAHVKKVRLSS